MHVDPQIAGISLGHADDQVGGARQGQRRRKAADDHSNLPLQPQFLQRHVDLPFLQATPRDEDMLAGSVTLRRYHALPERMAIAHHADEAVAKQRLRSQFRAGIVAHNTGLHIDRAVPEQRAVLVQLLRKIEPHAGRLLSDARDQLRPKIFDEALAGADREGPTKLFQIQRFGGPQGGLRLFDKRANTLAQFQCPRRRHETAPRPDQKRIAGCLAQAGERPAHGGGA